MSEIDNLLNQLSNSIKYKGKDADGNMIFEITPGFDVRQCLKKLFDAVGELQKNEKKPDGPMDILDKLSSLDVPFHDIKTAVIDSNKVELSFYETPVVSEEMELEPCQMMPADIFKDYCESIKKDVEEDFEKMSKDPDYGKGDNS